MKLNKDSLNDYRLHAITLLTGASAAVSQVDSLSVYAPVAAGLACLLSASSYSDLFEKVDDLADALADAGVIDEETADKIDEATDKIEEITDSE
tara:strand:+ start:10709 stop:10990 length:282 start_codon:yes stop_codon:yes gene_type:complete